MTDHVVIGSRDGVPSRDPAPEQLLDVERIHRAIAFVLAVTVLGAAWSLLSTYTLGLEGTFIGRMSTRMFGLNSEGGLPAAFSAALLVLAAVAVLLAMRTAVDEPSMVRYRTRWTLLALSLLAVAFDEAFAIHEELSLYLRETFDLSGVLTYAFIVPYGIAAGALAVVMIPALRTLPSRAAALIFAGGICYALGAVGMEMVGGQLETMHAPALLYEAEVVAEELLEMIGVWLFLGGVLTILRGRRVHLTIR